jgi:hypothetical protein
MSKRVDEDAIPSERRGGEETQGGSSGYNPATTHEEYYEDTVLVEPNYTHFELINYIRQKRMGITFTREELIELLYG